MKPRWLKSRIPSGKNYRQLKGLLQELRLNTVCEEARCPNIADCWERQTATIMIMGDICTRSCGFCAVHTGRPQALDTQEPEHVAQAVARLNLRYVVLTSVDRDDLDDGGSAHFAQTISAVRQACPQTKIEVLIPDFRGDEAALSRVFLARPDVLNHNLETVPSLQKQVRPQAQYDRSLKVLRMAAEAGLIAKSGLMLGLGEQSEELLQTLRDLRNRGRVELLTLGQYLRPTPNHLEVERYYSPEEFENLKTYAMTLGFSNVNSGPLVRSSYHADEAVDAVKGEKGSAALPKQTVKIIEGMGQET